MLTNPVHIPHIPCHPRCLPSNRRETNYSPMVCRKCESKLSKIAAPDPFTSTSTSIKEGGRRIGENKLLTRPGSKKNRFQPYQGKCKDCKQPVTQNRAKYCHGCAYRKGLCSICGKAILDTTGYAMSSK